MKIYYAHCVAIYNTPTEKRDLDVIVKLFPNAEIYNPNNEECQVGAKEKGMDFFKDLVQGCDMTIFRALPNGKIPSGVYKEIKWTEEIDNPVIELPCYTGREMSVDDTRQFLKEIGNR